MAIIPIKLGSGFNIDNPEKLATSTEILAGYTGVNENGDVFDGVIPTRAPYTIPNSNTNERGFENSKLYFRFPVGYYPKSGSLEGYSYVYCESVAFGNATAGDVASGKTFTSTSGLKISGSAYLVKTGDNIKSSGTASDTGGQSCAYLVVEGIVGTVYSISAKATNNRGFAASTWNNKATESQKYWAVTGNSASGGKAIVGSSGNFCPNLRTTSRTIWIPVGLSGESYSYIIVYK